MSQPIDFIFILFPFRPKLKQWTWQNISWKFRKEPAMPCGCKVLITASERRKLLNFNSISLVVVRLLLFVIARSLARPLVSF